MELEKIKKILGANSGKNFVDRILNVDKYERLDNKDGSYSTHSMAWGEVDDGKYIVYPTVVQKDGKLQRLKDKDAVDFAMKNKEFILVNSPSEASQLSKEYKKLWKKQFGAR